MLLGLGARCGPAGTPCGRPCPLHPRKGPRVRALGYNRESMPNPRSHTVSVEASLDALLEEARLAALKAPFDAGDTGLTVQPPALPATDLRRPAAWGGSRQVGLSKAAQYGVKRLLDIVGSAVLLVLMLPLMLLIALAVKLTSRGPVLYRSTRLGLGGRRFQCLKFRTMHLGAEGLQQALEGQNEASGPLFKIAHDPRVTSVGRFLRATALDELPQFLNILRGEMSLVGPRPLPMRDCNRLASHEHYRHSVLPGITGLWQVGPERHDPDGTPVVQLDLEYVDRWSLWLDVKITLRTVVVVLRGGADASGPPAGASAG